MTDTYTSSKGEVTLIKDMANPHLIHSIAKLARTIGFNEALAGEANTDTTQEDTLKALKVEAINRLTPKE